MKSSYFSSLYKKTSQPDWHKQENQLYYPSTLEFINIQRNIYKPGFP